MKQKIFYVVIVGIAGFAAYYLFSPLFITKIVSEDMAAVIPEGAQAEIVSRGTFEGLLFHNAEGTAELVKSGDRYFIRFEDDFNVTNGPDLVVQLGRDGERDGDVTLGDLKGNVGSQNYAVPAAINPFDYNEVYIWCRAFFVPFGKAVLK